MPHDPGPMARFESIKADPMTPSVVFKKMCEGETPEDIAREWKVPKGMFTEWFTVEHADRYDAALKVITEGIAHKVLKLLGGVTGKNMGVVKTQVDGYLKLMAKWNRPRYGETVRVEKSVAITADAGLVGFAGELLRLVAKPKERVIEQDDPEQLPAPQ